MGDGVAVREATVDDELAVRRVLDAAMLETGRVPAAVARGDAFVAAAEGRVVGALVLVPHSTVDLPAELAGSGGMHVDAVAVRRRRRGQVIGRALVEAVLERERRLTVAFDPGVRAFYDALAFTTVIESEGETDGRAWAVRERNASLDG